MDNKELCGGCQAWGYNPDIIDGVCETCHRTTEKIEEAHGTVKIKDEEQYQDFLNRIEELMDIDKDDSRAFEFEYLLNAILEYEEKFWNCK